MKTPRERQLITTPRRRFLWLLRFTQLDLATLRTGDLWNLKEELRDFLLPLRSSLVPGGLHTHPTTGPMPEAYTLQDVQTLQNSLREALTWVLVSRVDPTKPRYMKLPSLEYAALDVLPDHAAPGEHLLSVQGTVHDLVMLLFYHLMASQNTAALARCSECDRVFLRQTNQRYCGKGCANRVAKRHWLERQHAPVASEV